MEREQPQRATYVLLIVAALGLVVAAGAFLIERQISTISLVALVVAVLGLASYVFVEPERVRRWFLGRQVKYGGNATLMTIFLLAILVLLNYLGINHSQRWDVTGDRQYTLSPQTLQVLEQMQGPVHAVGFFWPGQEGMRRQAEDLLDQYKQEYPALTVEMYDPQSKPSKAQEWGYDDTRPQLILVYGMKREDIHSMDEVNVTSALVRLARETQPLIYFLTGHGEREIQGGAAGSLSSVAQQLQNEGYRVETLTLLTAAAVPADAAAVVIADPRTSLQPEEIAALDSYVASGGSLLIMAEPPIEEGSPVDTTLDGWIEGRFGLRFLPDIVIDQLASMVTDYLTPVSNSYGQSPITENMGGLITAFPTARSIYVSGEVVVPESVTVTPLVKTSENSWGEANVAGLRNGEAGYDAGQDAQGPLTVAASVEDASSGARVVLFGDADFASDAYSQAMGNADLFLNTLNWLAEDESLISLRPRDATQRQLIFPGRLAFNAIFAVIVVMLPLAVLAAGVAVWVVRRARR